MAKFTIVLFTLIIYLLILAAFNKARAKHKNGNLGSIINVILITTILLFLADYMHLLNEWLSENFVYSLQALLRAGALAFLGFGGMKIVRQTEAQDEDVMK